MGRRIVACPNCHRRVWFEDDRLLNTRVLIRCRQCTLEWWVDVLPVASSDHSGVVVTSDLELAHQQARRLARLLVNELLLYHQDIVRQATTRAEILDALRTDIELARRHYFSRIAPELRNGPDYFQQALQEILLAGKA